MKIDITKKCADSLRELSLNKYGIQLKSSHAHELVAAYFGYSSRASLRSDSMCPISNLNKADFIVLTPTNFVTERCKNLQGLPENLPHELVEGVYSPLYDEQWIKQPIWPSLEELGKELADQHMKSKAVLSRDLKLLKQGVKVEHEKDEIAIVVFREYVSPSLSLSFQEGKRGIVDVFNLKRIAGYIGYVKTNHYSAEAETLDAAIMKMRDGYHQIITSAQISGETATMVEPEPSFSDWLSKHKNRNSPLGDLASKRGFADKSQPWPSYENIEDYKNYLLENNSPWGAMKALEQAWKSYKTYLQKKRRHIQ